MRRQTVPIFVALSLALASTAFTAPTTLVQDWFTSTGVWFDTTADNARGMAYNSTTDHLYVVSRKSYARTVGQAASGLHIAVIDAATGLQLPFPNDELSTSTIDGTNVTHILSRIVAADDGRIYACNLALATRNLRVYRWDNEAATPVKIYDAVVTVRLGDSMGVAGSGSGTRVYVSGNDATAPMLVLDDAGAVISNFNLAGGITGTLDQIGPESAGGNFWATKPGMPLGQYSNTGALLNTVDGGIVPAACSTALFEGAVSLPVHGNRDLVLTNRGYNAPDNKVMVVDVSTPASPEVLYESPSVGNVTIGGTLNGTFAVAWKASTQSVFAMSERNGLGKYTIPVPPAGVSDWSLY